MLRKQNEPGDDSHSKEKPFDSSQSRLAKNIGVALGNNKQVTLLLLRKSNQQNFNGILTNDISLLRNPILNYGAKWDTHLTIFIKSLFTILDSIGPSSVSLREHERNIINAARLAGKNQAEIHELVTQLGIACKISTIVGEG